VTVTRIIAIHLTTAAVTTAKHR